jgi:2-succinyl-6-hydroxy-2,4-cyclohexadiene-1-carboxylate synthase
VIFLHGFTGTGLDVLPLLPALAGPEVVSPDLPGHGATPPPPDGPEATPKAVRAALASLVAGPFDLIGYSQGGRLALDFACSPESRDRVRRLVLISASPGLADPDERAARTAADATLADRLEADGTAAFLDVWNRQPMFARSPERLGQYDWARLVAPRLAASASGLATALRGLGTAALPPRWAALRDLRRPVLLLTGAEDAKFGSVARTMCAHLPAARHVEVPGAHHAAHLENPTAAGEAIAGFLR